MNSDNFIINDSILVKPLSNEIEILINSNQKKLFKIEPRIMKVLLSLVARRDQVVTRESLIDEIWENEYVGDDALTQAISKLRKVIEWDKKLLKIIETIPKSGYRFIGAITALDDQIESSSLKQVNKKSYIPMFFSGILIVLTLLLVAFLFNDRSQTKRISNRLQFTSDPGRENYPAISPNNTEVIFSKRNPSESKMNLYVKSLNSNEIRRLTESASDDYSPAWSSNGKLIAYLRLANGYGEIFILPLHTFDTGFSGQLLVKLNFTNQSTIAWSPNNNFILYRDKISANSNFRLFNVNTETRVVAEIGPNLSPQYDYSNGIYSADGNSVVYTKRLNEFDIICTLNLNNPDQNETELLRFQGIIKDLEWSDEQSLIFVGEKNGQSGLWTLSIQTSELIWIGGERISSFSYSESLQTIIYSELDYNIDLLQFLSDDSGNSSKPVFSSTKAEWLPSLAPNDSALVFVSDRSGRDQIWKANLISNELTQMTFYQNEVVKRPKWSPIGNMIAFELLGDEVHSIYLLDVKGGKAQQLLKNGFDNREISWSTDASQIYYQSNKSGRKEIWSIDVANNSTKQVTHIGAFYGEESADKNYLYLTKSDGRNGLWRQNLKDSNDLKQVHRFPYLFNASNWTLSETGFYFKDPLNTDYRLSISHFNFSTLKTNPLLFFNTGSINSTITFDVSNDKKQIFYSNLVKLESDLIRSKIKAD